MFDTIIYIWIAIAIIVHFTMFYVTAPFGRHTSNNWGPTMDNKLAWCLMEIPSFLIMGYFLLWGSHSFSSYAWVLFSLWIAHYFNRSIIYPLRIKATPKRMPISIALNAVFFNLVNAGTNGYYLAEIASPEQYGAQWLASWHFILGLIMFVGGAAINIYSDHFLIHLRKPGETGYKIPMGFLFKYVSSPNLFGEIIQWVGFAVMAWNLPALSFAIWTYANLVPRAKNHHDWYLSKFADYPKERKVVFPFVY